jgi:hypothetical protein
VFKRIRALEGLTDEDVIKSFSSMSDPNVKRSQGKGDCFFVSTDDNRLIIKTLKNDEKETLLGQFLFFYFHHLDTNPESLICRIYGVYKIKIGQTGDPLYIMILRDARGPLKKVKTYLK